MCSDDMERVCDANGTWQPGGPCPCSTNGGQCTTCGPANYKTCKNDQLWICKGSSQWNAPAGCPMGCTDDGLGNASCKK
jgi:hypothetical protein